MKASLQRTHWFGIFVVALVISEITFIAAFSAASVIYEITMQDLVLGLWISAGIWLPLVHVPLFLVWILLVRRAAIIGVLEASLVGCVTGLTVAALAIFTPLL